MPYTRIQLEEYESPLGMVAITLDVDFRPGYMSDVEDVKIVVTAGEVVGETANRKATPEELEEIQKHVESRYNDGGDRYDRVSYGWRSFQDFIDEACREKV